MVAGSDAGYLWVLAIICISIGTFSFVFRKAIRRGEIDRRAQLGAASPRNSMSEPVFIALRVVPFWLGGVVFAVFALVMT